MELEELKKQKVFFAHAVFQRDGCKATIKTGADMPYEYARTLATSWSRLPHVTECYVIQRLGNNDTHIIDVLI